MKKISILALFVLGACFSTAFLSIQRMDSKLMIDPENPSVSARAYSEQVDSVLSERLARR